MKRIVGLVLCTTILLLGILSTHPASATETILPQPDFPQNYQSWQHIVTPCATDITEKNSFTLSDFGTINPKNGEMQVVKVLRFNDKLVFYEYMRGTKNALGDAFVYFPATEGFAKLDLQDKKDDEKIGDRMVAILGINNALAFVMCEKLIWSTEEEKFFDTLEDTLKKSEKAK